MTKCYKCFGEIPDETLLTKVGPLFIQLCEHCRKLYKYKIRRANGLWDYYLAHPTGPNVVERVSIKLNGEDNDKKTEEN